MKILGISKLLGEEKYESAIDLWRIKRPLLELQKHTDWQIDFQPHLIRDPDKYTDPDLFMKEQAEKEVAHLGQYDIIFTSYFTSPHLYTLLWAAAKEYGTEFILDIDDDLFDVDPENPFWLGAGEDGAFFLRTMVQVTKYLSTTNKALADKFKQKSEVEASVFVNPNYIADQYPEYEPNNGDKIIIGYFGGASHYHDLHETGVLPAIKQIMEEHKNVYFYCAGQPVDVHLPELRTKNIPIAQGTAWPEKLFPTLNFDITIAPLRPTEFNKHKSNIKWQEATRMGSAFVGSDVGPYKSIRYDSAITVPNTRDAWYMNLKELVENEKKRKAMVANARKAVSKLRLEDNWKIYKQMFEEVYNANH